MNLTDQPLANYINAVNAGDMPPQALADYLTEQGCELRDVLLLFAGTAPEWVDGLPQSVLVAWLHVSEPNQLAGFGRWRWEAIANMWTDGVTVIFAKRRVLALFPEVRVERRFEASFAQLAQIGTRARAIEATEELLIYAGWHDPRIGGFINEENRCVVWSEMCLIADLIPPEPMKGTRTREWQTVPR